MKYLKKSNNILSEILTLDARSLAIFRILLSLGMIFDLANRLKNFDFFYSNVGILPVQLWNEIWGSKPYYWSLHLSDSNQVIQITF